MKSRFLFAITAIIMMFDMTSCSTTVISISSDNNTISSENNNLSNVVTFSENSLKDKAHSVYNGTLNNNDILMDIYREGNSLTAFYIFRDSNKEIAMMGTINNGTLTLFQKGENNHLTGTLKEDDSLDAIFVTDGKETKSVYKLDHVVPSESVQTRYPGYDTNEIESFAESIKRYILANDKESLSKFIAYPVKINKNGIENTIENASEFVENYDTILTNNLKRDILNAYTKFMFNNWQGIMFGSVSHNMWIDVIKGSGLKIYTINN